ILPVRKPAPRGLKGTNRLDISKYAVRKTRDEATKSLCRKAPEATHQATSKRRGDVEDLRAGSTTESTQTRSYWPSEVSFPPLLGHASTSPRTSSVHTGLGRLGRFPDRHFSLA